MSESKRKAIKALKEKGWKTGAISFALKVNHNEVKRILTESE